MWGSEDSTMESVLSFHLFLSLLLLKTGFLCPGTHSVHQLALNSKRSTRFCLPCHRHCPAPSIFIWVLGIKLGHQACTANTFTRWAPALACYFKIKNNYLFLCVLMEIRRGAGSLELELHTVVSLHVCVLGIKPMSSGRAATALNQWITSLAQSTAPTPDFLRHVS